MGIVDLHCDTISVLRGKKRKGEEVHLRKNNLHLDLERMKEQNYLLQCFAMFIYMKSGQDPYESCKELISVFKDEMELNKDMISQVYSYSDIEKNMKEGKMSALLTFEDGCSLEGDMAKLDEFYKEGLRMIALTWNFENEIGYPNFDYPDGDFHTPNTDKKYGLKPFGKELVKRMSELGIIVDCSHLSDAGFYDVASLVPGPFICSHSDVRNICGVVRNMTDDMIHVIMEHRGIIGINYCKDFVKDGVDTCTIDDTIEHVIYLKNMGAIDNIALGSDFDGIGDENELNKCDMMTPFINRLREKGFTEEEIEKITYKNALRVFKEVLK